MVEHTTRKHALLSASGASRWMNCPPSARMEEKRPEKENSSFAEEGTLAHEFADLELRLRSYVGKNSGKKDLLKQKEVLKKHELYKVEMHDYVDVYVDYVMEQFTLARKTTKDAVLKIEERTDFSYLVPGGFGTSDANVIGDGVLEIADLKYGKGLKVDAAGNGQLRLYALGLLRKFDLVYDIKRVKMTIVQPRLYHIDSETLTVEELVAWAENEVKPAAEKADKGEGDCNPGDWCRWCKAKPVCRALGDFSIKLAAKDFEDPKTYSDDEVIENYSKLGIVTLWAKSLAEAVLSEAMDGKKWPGYKLVEGRSKRIWADEEKAKKALVDYGDDISEDQVTNTKLKGIGDMEKLIGKAHFFKLGLTVKPAGKPTLVEESDKRPELGVDQAKKDFE